MEINLVEDWCTINMQNFEINNVKYEIEKIQSVKISVSLWTNQYLSHHGSIEFVKNGACDIMLIDKISEGISYSQTKVLNSSVELFNFLDSFLSLLLSKKIGIIAPC